MPIKIPDNLPAYEILNNENIFIMNESRAYHQDIRTLKIAILNLMPSKIVTETQLLRLLSNSPLQVDVTLLNPKTCISKNAFEKNTSNFFKTFEEVKEDRFDGLIITGAPVEHLEFEEVTFWNELKEIMEWSIHNVYSTFHIGWGAQAALFYHYGLKKYPLNEKKFGVFTHKVCKKNIKLLRGFDDLFEVPYSTYTEVQREDIERVNGLKILAESAEEDVYIVSAKEGRQIFVTGHPEYDLLTLKTEYDQEVNKDLDAKVPKGYFPDDDPSRNPKMTWKSHANLLFGNWLNYYVYQETPYELSELMYFI